MTRIGSRPVPETLTHSCDAEIRADEWAMSGWRQEGEEWKCSCGTVYVHICDEAEGCFWAKDPSQTVADAILDEPHIIRGEE